jgi:hypothetical protein
MVEVVEVVLVLKGLLTVDNKICVIGPEPGGSQTNLNEIFQSAIPAGTISKTSSSR